MPSGAETGHDDRYGDAAIHSVQAHHAASGVALAPAYCLNGEHVPSLRTGIRDAEVGIAACASGCMRNHPGGPMAGRFFAGGVSVSPEHRGCGPGLRANAALLAGAVGVSAGPGFSKNPSRTTPPRPR